MSKMQIPGSHSGISRRAFLQKGGAVLGTTFLASPVLGATQTCRPNRGRTRGRPALGSRQSHRMAFPP